MDIQRELSTEERAVVAERLLVEQRLRFDGVRKAAYTAAGVNPATWARATAGERVRPDRLVLIVKSLWPESRGEWGSVPPAPPSSSNHEYSGPTWVADVDDPWVEGLVTLKGYVDEQLGGVDERFDELEERVRELERILLGAIEPEGGDGDADDTGGSASTRTPEAEPANQSATIDREKLSRIAEKLGAMTADPKGDTPSESVRTSVKELQALLDPESSPPLADESHDDTA